MKYSQLSIHLKNNSSGFEQMVSKIYLTDLKYIRQIPQILKPP